MVNPLPFAPTTPTSPFEEGYQAQQRAYSLPENLYLSPIYAAAPSFERAFYNDTIVGVLGNIAAVKGLGWYDSARGMEPLTPTEAKEQYGVSVKEDTHRSVVEYMYGRKKLNSSLEDKLSAVEEGAFTTAISFVSAIPAHIPEGIALSKLFMPMLGGLAAKFNMAEKMVRLGPIARASNYLGGETIGAAVSRGALFEIGQTAAEAPLRHYSAELVSEQYGISEFATDAVISGLAGGVIGGAGEIFKRLRARPEMGEKAKIYDRVEPAGNTPPPETPANKARIAGLLTNRSPEAVGPRLLENRLHTPINPNSPYRYTDMPVEDMKASTFYSGHTTQDKFDFNTQVKYNEQWGRGIVLSDSLDLVHNMSGSGGTVMHATLVDNVKIFDANTLVDIELRGKILDVFEEYAPRDEYLDIVTDKTTLKDIFEEARILSEVEGHTGPLEELHQIFRDMGYGGYKFTGQMGDGKFNGLFIFEPESIVVRDIETSRSNVVDLTPEDLAELEIAHAGLLDYKKSMDYEPEYDVMKDIEITTHLEHAYVMARYEKEIATLSEEIKGLYEISGFGKDISMDEIMEIAANKVIKNYRGKQEIIDKVKSALEKKTKDLADEFGLPPGLVDQRKLIDEILDDIVTPTREKVDVESEFLQEISRQIEDAQDIFKRPVDQLNEEQIVKIARREVLKGIVAKEGYDKAREAAKALVFCRRNQ